MPTNEIPQMIASLAFFGLMVICPLTMLFLRHQRQMAELIHGKMANEALQRLETVERELRDLKAAQNAQILRDDDKRELGLRTT